MVVFRRYRFRFPTAFSQLCNSAAPRNLPECTSPKMFIETLSIKRLGTQSTRCDLLARHMFLRLGLAAVHVFLSTRERLLNAMGRNEMFEEGFAAVESPLASKGISRTEPALHSLFEVTERMSDPVICPGETLDMVLTVSNRTFLRSFRLVGE